MERKFKIIIALSVLLFAIVYTMVIYKVSKKVNPTPYQTSEVKLSANASQTFSLPANVKRIEIEQPTGWVALSKGQTNFVGFKVYYNVNLIIVSSQSIDVTFRFYT